MDQRNRRQLTFLQRLGQRRGEPSVIHDRVRAGVAQQVHQFVGNVAIVDVERGDPGLVRTEHGLEELVAVRHVQPEMALTRFMWRQLGAFPMRAEPPRVQRPGEAAGTFVGLREGESPVSEHDAVPVGVGRRHRREHLGEIEFSLPTLLRPSEGHATTQLESDGD